MPTRASRRCTTPGCRNPAGPNGKCTQRHAAQHEAARRRLIPTKVAERQPAVRAHRADAVQRHVARYGWVCLGDDDHPRHDTRDLVADDPTPIARGGDPMQPLNVTCRRANSSKGARTTRP